MVPSKTVPSSFSLVKEKEEGRNGRRSTPRTPTESVHLCLGRVGGQRVHELVHEGLGITGPVLVPLVMGGLLPQMKGGSGDRDWCVGNG